MKLPDLIVLNIPHPIMTSTKKCWHCTHTLHTPFMINFCSEACAFTYYRLRNEMDICSMIRYNYENANHKVLHPAPPHTELIEFGGTLTIDEFRKK